MIQSAVDRLIMSIAGAQVGNKLMNKNPSEFDDFENEIANIETAKRLGIPDPNNYPLLENKSPIDIDFTNKDINALSYDSGRGDKALKNAAREAGSKSMMKESFQARLKNAKMRKIRMQSVGGKN